MMIGKLRTLIGLLMLDVAAPMKRRGGRGSWPPFRQLSRIWER